ncbi:hypothetical protein [Kordia sp.]|uniref:hypothetical protein n=1 Tax=Kordia sp. TaxID=1965332 RepID=UPI003B5BAF93
MKRSVKQILMLALIITAFSKTSSAQTKKKETTNANKFYVTFHVGFGSMIAKDRRSLSSSLMLQLQNKKLWGFGLNTTSALFDSKPFDSNPPSTSIRNFNPTVDEPFTRVRRNGLAGDSFGVFAAFASKGYKINNRFIIDFQLGPSLVRYKEHNYSYSYSPRTSPGFFGVGSPPTLVVQPEETSGTIIYGTHVRASIQCRFFNRTVIELAPFLNLNRKRNLFGIHLGIVFGRGYKEKIVQPEKM